MDAAPCMRAGVLQGNLAALDDLGASAARRVRDALPAAVLEEVEQASRIAWLPLEHDIALTEAVDRELGRERCVQWARQAMLDSLRTPLLRPVWKAAFRMFGLSPAALFRTVPTGWKAVYRNVGAVSYEGAPGESRLELLGAPSVLTGDPAYLAAMCGAFSAAFDLAEVTGTVTLAGVDDRIAFIARWRDESSG